MNRLRSTPLKVGQKLIVPRPKMIAAKAADSADTGESGGDEEEQADGRIGEQQDKEDPGVNIGNWNSPDERNLFIRVVKTFLGVPYRYGGSTLKGIDCSAFVKRVYEIVDINLPRTAREQSQFGKWVKKNELEEGDLVFFKTRRINDHVGIYIGNNEFVHLSSRSREAKVDNLEEPYFNKRFIRGVRVKELKKTSGTQARLQEPPIGSMDNLTALPERI